MNHVLVNSKLVAKKSDCLVRNQSDISGTYLLITVVIVAGMCNISLYYFLVFGQQQYDEIAKLIFNLNFEDEIALILFSPATQPPTPTEKVVLRLKTTSDET